MGTSLGVAVDVAVGVDTGPGDDTGAVLVDGCQPPTG